MTVAVDSILASHSYKYFGKEKGITIYMFIDERQILFYSTVMSACEREAAYVIDGLLHTCNWNQMGEKGKKIDAYANRMLLVLFLPHIFPLCTPFCLQIMRGAILLFFNRINGSLLHCYLHLVSMDSLFYLILCILHSLMNGIE